VSGVALIGAFGLFSAAFGAAHLLWDVTLERVRIDCLIRNVRLRAIEDMRRAGYVEWADYAARHWKDPR
jgi:hypothetical protein